VKKVHRKTVTKNENYADSRPEKLMTKFKPGNWKFCKTWPERHYLVQKFIGF